MPLEINRSSLFFFFFEISQRLSVDVQRGRQISYFAVLDSLLNKDDSFYYINQHLTGIKKNKGEKQPVLSIYPAIFDTI